MPFLQHIVELRRRIIYSVIAVLLGAIVCWVFYGWIQDLLIDPYCEVVSPDATISDTERILGEGNCRLLSTDPLEPISVRFTVAGYGGLALAMPFILWQAWRFVVPAFKKTEKRYALFFVLTAVLLFLAGAVLAYWTIPRALGFLTTIGGDDLVNIYSPRNYVSFIVKMMLAFGIGFEFPVVLVFSQLIGLVQTATLRKNRRYALAIIVVLGAVITPSGDPITLIVLSVPLYIFYELSIVFGLLRARKQNKELVSKNA